jgi:hypothetical protein
MGNSESTGNQTARPSAQRTVTSNNAQRSRAPPTSSGTLATGYPDNGPISSDSNNPPSDAPGCYRMPGTPRNQRFYVTIPRGVRPGQHFAVLVNGQQMMVKCPDTNKPGDRLIVTAPRQASQQYVVIVPPNVRPLEQFRVMINSQEVMVTCPRGVRTGQRVTFTLPTPQERTTTQAAPNHQMFEVIVPDGVKPGQTFALLANSQRVMVTCPPTVKPGQKIRFQLPIQLSQEQLQGIKVSYDKDGWMRCLGQDLKFHWVYNTSDSEKKSDFKTQFDIDAHAFVRELVPLGNISLFIYQSIYISTHLLLYLTSLFILGNNQFKLQFMAATEYAIETSVKGTGVNYQELNSIAQLPFQSKVDWLKTQFSSIRIPWEEGHIKIKVRRQSLMQDAMDAIGSIQPADMKKIFRFEFIGEPALDAGGVAREFYMCICEQLFNPDCGLFLYSAVNQMCMQINLNSEIANEHHLRYFHMAGRILGKALMDGQITPVHLVQPIYKHLMGWPINMKDLEHIDDEIFRNLLQLLDMEDVGMLYLDFVVTEDKLGQVQTVDLIEGGGNIFILYYLFIYLFIYFNYVNS